MRRLTSGGYRQKEEKTRALWWADMKPELPPELMAERGALLEEIYAAFKGVNREGGLSWSETYVLDNHGTLEERAKARNLDTDVRWEDLVEGWTSAGSSVAFVFLDPIGFRYYLPVQMVRTAQESDSSDDTIAYDLTVRRWRLGPERESAWKERRMKKFSLVGPRQRLCVQRFLLYMEALDRLREEPVQIWTEALDSYWRCLPDGYLT